MRWVNGVFAKEDGIAVCNADDARTRQLAAAADFGEVEARSCPPVAHGLASAARVMVWRMVSAGYRIALAAETGALRGHIVTQNLTFAARKAAVITRPAQSC